MAINLLNTNISNLQLHMELLEQAGIMITLKDRAGRYVMSNQLTARRFGYANSDSMKGTDAYALRCPAVECADEFMSQSGHVVDHRIQLTLFEIMTYADGQQKASLTKKNPFIWKGTVAGSLCHGYELQYTNLGQISSLLVESDKRYYPKGKRNRSYTVENFLGNRDGKLSRRELDCLFYVVRGQTMKETARVLGIGWRTVESYVNNIKKKWGCSTKNAVIEHAIARGFLNYLPKLIALGNTSHLLNTNIIPPLDGLIEDS